MDPGFYTTRREVNVVEDLDPIQSKISVANSVRVRHFRVLSSSVCIRAQKDSTTALSKASPHGAERVGKAGVSYPLAEGPRRVLRAVVAVDQRTGAGLAGLDGHSQRRVDHGRRRSTIERPSHHPTEPGVEHHAAVQLSLAGGVLGDVGHPQLVGTLAAEVPLHQSTPVAALMGVDFALRRRGRPLMPFSAMMAMTSFLFTTWPKASIAPLGCAANHRCIGSGRVSR